jgi:hypothetical protein
VNKPKRGDLSDAMRSRLLINRHGRLTTDQWKDIVVEPITPLLLLLLPGVVVLGPRLGALIWGGVGLTLLAALIAVGVALLFRARRYARAPIHFAVMRGQTSSSFWRFWQPLSLQSDSGEIIHFGKRLAPYLPVRPDQSYLVYYLREPRTHILLSIAPADHPDADIWQPSENFSARYHQRAGR